MSTETILSLLDKLNAANARIAAFEGENAYLTNWKREGADEIVRQTLNAVRASDRVAALEAALKACDSALGEIETANDALCAERSTEVYNLMIDGGQSNLLMNLDDARRNARAVRAGAAKVLE